MTDTVYPNARKLFLDGDIDMLNDDIRVVLIDEAVAGYVSGATNMSALSAAFASTQISLANKSTTGGVFDADNVTFPNVPIITGPGYIEAWVVFKYTGATMANNIPIFYTNESAGLPVLPNGGPINLNFDNGANKIFAF